MSQVIYRRLVSALALILTSSHAFTEENKSPLGEQISDLRYSEEAVQWTPHSTTVITKDELEATFRRDLEDLEGLAPGLIIDRLNTTPRGAAIAIRGLGSSDTSKGSEPAVAVNIDGVYVGSHTSRLQVLFDFEKVEIVRGADPIYTSAPNHAGAINLTRTKPTGELDVDVRLSGGDHDRREYDAVFNFPVVEDLSGKLAVYFKDRGGDYQKNLYSGRNENTEDYLSLSASFLWSIKDYLTLQYTYDNEASDESAPALLNVSNAGDLLCSTSAATCRIAVGVPQTGRIGQSAQNFSNDRQYDGGYHTLRAEFTVAGHDVLSITAIRDSDETSDLDLDATYRDFYHVSQEQEYNQFSQDLRVRADYSDKLDYSFGAYFMKTDHQISQQEFHILKQLGDAGFTDGHAAAEIAELKSEEKTDLRSTFAHLNYVINKQWIGDIGVRWTETEKKFEHNPGQIRLGNLVSPLRTLLVGQDISSEVLISGGFAYKVDDEAMIYMRYAEGMRPGGFDENAVSAFSGNSYGSEKSRMAEIGLKSDWMQDRLRVNVAYFRNEIKDKVERYATFTPAGQIESVLGNVADVGVSGYEIEVEARPFDSFYLRGTFSSMDADYDKYDVTDLTDPTKSVDLSGLDPNRAASNQLFLSMHYSFSYGPGLIHTYAGYTLMGDYQTNPLIVESAVHNYTNWDLAVSYEWQAWLFRIFSKNVNNSRHLQNATRVLQTDILAVPAGNTSVPGLITFAEYNQPRYTGFEIVYTPHFGGK